jgi:hypothetical protein
VAQNPGSGRLDDWADGNGAPDPANVVVPGRAGQGWPPGPRDYARPDVVGEPVIVDVKGDRCRSMLFTRLTTICRYRRVLGMNDAGGFFAQQDALREMADALRGLLSEGDECIYYTAVRMGPYNESMYWAVRPDGKYEMSKGRANALMVSAIRIKLSRPLYRLVDACYRDGKGTWFGLGVTVTPDGAVTAEYNYTTEPEWRDPITPTFHLREQEKYPRDEAHQPGWFKRRLVEAAAIEDGRS